MGFPDSKWQPWGEHVMSSWARESRAVHWLVFCKWVQVIKVSARDIFLAGDPLGSHQHLLFHGWQHSWLRVSQP
jgi:hypothetical protein